MMKLWIRKIVIVYVVIVVMEIVIIKIGSHRVLAQDQSAEVNSSSVVVLDTYSMWRMYHVLKPPVIQQVDGVKQILYNIKWLDWETPPPPVDWIEPKMDDSCWVRGPASRFARTPYLARLCLRGKFEVLNPSRVKGLSLLLYYYGGVIVYLNGKEICRGHFPLGADAEQSLAENYPLEAFVDENGEWLEIKPDSSRIGLRTRNLSVSIPKDLLRKGLNVLAIDIIRAPYHRIVEEKRGSKRLEGKKDGYVLGWNTCEVQQVRLTANSSEGLVPNARRPAGLQVWNADILASDVDVDFGDRTEPLRPIILIGVRNGIFTGKVIVGRDKPIYNLKVTASNLKSDTAVISAEHVSFWYGVSWGNESLSKDCRLHPQGAVFLNALSQEPLKEFSMRVDGVVVPIWVRVKIPKNTQPGMYSGVVTISMLGEPSIQVPIELKVLPWMLPDSQDFRTWVELIQSPDTLSVEYNVPLWSNRHWELIARSFQLISDTGTRVVYIPVIAHTNLGNAESMIRWIKKADGKYDWDFSVMDKYLDVVEKNLGKPKLVILQVWEVYMSSKESAGRRFGERLDEQQKVSGGAPLVTRIDPITGRTENITLPKLSDPVSKPIWQALLNQVRERLKKRGLEKTLMLGMFTDSMPSKEDTKFFLDIAPDLAWVQQGHNVIKDLYGIVKTGYTATWWSQHFADDTVHTRADNRISNVRMESLYGWKNPRLDVLYDRSELGVYPSTRWRFDCETAITGDIMRGIGRIGADFWKAIKDKNGNRIGYVHSRFPDGNWQAVAHDINSGVLAPQLNGPVATNHLVALVEGIQECEARIFIEQVLIDESLRSKLGPDLTKRCKDVLEQRLLYMWKCLANMQMGLRDWDVTTWRFSPGIAGHIWFLSTNWQKRSEELYTLAGDVQKRIEK